eukprot:7072067-Lingulodinium_polyedra.AAC.1
MIHVLRVYIDRRQLHRPSVCLTSPLYSTPIIPPHCACHLLWRFAHQPNCIACKVPGNLNGRQVCEGHCHLVT